MIDRYQPSTPVLVDFVDFRDGPAADLARPVLARPIGHIRSPLVGRRSDPPLQRGERENVELPPLRAFIGPLAWAIVPGLPVLMRVGWQAAVVVGVMSIIFREARRHSNRSTICFADGFLAYAGDSRWPHGVQEDDDVHWNWSTSRLARPGHGAGG